mmetsp:Transcript_17803/g.12754  ORF Transcript_17803/g.12754 Transcript_17803/m.12754 type:complete len:82 (+) Transcript_17803:31-276(+)
MFGKKGPKMEELEDGRLFVDITRHGNMDDEPAKRDEEALEKMQKVNLEEYKRFLRSKKKAKTITELPEKKMCDPTFAEEND